MRWAWIAFSVVGEQGGFCYPFARYPMEPQSPVSEKTNWVTPRRSHIRLDVLSCRLGAVCACLSSVLVVALECARRYEISIAQNLDWCGRGLVLAIGVVGLASFVTGAAALYQVCVPKRFAITGIVLPLLSLPLVFVCVQGYVLDRRVDSRSRNCIGHIQYIGDPLEEQFRKTPDLILPATADLKTVLLTVTPDAWDKRSVDTIACTCSESYIRRREVGYIYVGDGLRLRDVVEKNIPIIFCPASNHRDFGRWCYVWPFGKGERGVGGMSNTDAIALFEDALARSRSGGFSYSPRAIAVLEREIAARRAPIPGKPLGMLLLAAVLGLAGLIVGVEVFVRKRMRSVPEC